jgi:adenine-specific DNA-methyltransferase
MGTLAKNLRAEIDEEKIEAFRGTESLPFELETRKQVAVKTSMIAVLKV